MAEQTITIALTKAQALVFFDWLNRNEGALAFDFEDQAEEHVIWAIEGQLERILVEPLDQNYSKILDEARKMVREDGTANGR